MTSRYLTTTPPCRT